MEVAEVPGGLCDTDSSPWNREWDLMHFLQDIPRGAKQVPQPNLPRITIWQAG